MSLMPPRVTAATNPTSVRGGEIIACEPWTSTLSIALLAAAAIAEIAFLGNMIMLFCLWFPSCHGAPVIKFTDVKGQVRRCELADLLVVVDVRNHDSFVRRAALIQAKMARAHKRVSLSGPSSRLQLDLYQHWPRFDFEETAYKLNHIDFRAGGAGPHSGTFGVIDRHLTNQPIWTQHGASPTPAIILNQSRLGEFIAEMVAGTRVGFGRLATPSLRTDWSEVVERLLTVTYAPAFHHKMTFGPAGAPRGVTAVACLNYVAMANMTRKTWGGSGGLPPFDDVIVREDDRQPVGINTLHITIGQVPDSGP
jgi:hypothetical protein